MAEDKRRSILHATLCLLASRGLHGFSMKQLAEKAGVAAGTIYLYFEDKDDLIRQLHEDIIREVARRIFFNYDPSIPLYDQYRRMMENLWSFHKDCPEIMLSKAQFDTMPPDLLFGHRGKDPDTLNEQRETVLAVFQPMADLYEAGRASGVIKPLPDELLSALCIDPLCALAREHHLGMTKLGDKELAAVIAAGWDAISIHH
ncbi:TetR/AcrR family transcriptional regulator [Gilvimarinus sp. DA14]|uniref:TetR/AcrR family transcriptional regulator n=1 Tax=Gilvimarinus sp. DA14 TaxID=2956798 RepID=UPI0020B818D0|nr:TetR/AcrR family transcriptional regulator [Gilvimarinus sp. DA14]UTF59879.1 TetR/AcrR family transcriptional regulator [Gilvimarinus sp. DA14]